MNIRGKIILIVLPILMSALLINGIISSMSARSGMTRIAMNFLGFKAEELEKYARNQWNLLVANDLAEIPEYVDVTQKAVSSYARTLIRSRTEVILAFTGELAVPMSTGPVDLSTAERIVARELMKSGTEGWVELGLNGKERVGHAFFFEPFGWYVLITEESDAFYREVREITQQSGIVLGASSAVALVFLLVFAGYLTRPLRKVAGTMKTIIRTNDMSTRVDVEYRDEIGALAKTFNIMTEHLENAYRQIRRKAFEAVIARRNEHKIRNIFQKYVPKNVIDSIFENPESMMEGEDRVLAILFTDIRSFTTISEGFTPDQLVVSLNKYFGMMVDIIMAHGGIVDKYIGDAVMAFYGAPVKHDNDAEHAVISALEMQEALKKFNAEHMAQGKPAFKTGIGVNYGVVTVGNIGSEKKMDYTIIGDMVNYGSRLEGLTKKYGQEIILSESVHRKIKERIPCRPVDKVQVKGKTSGEMVYTAALELSDHQKKGWAYHQAGLKRYYDRNFTEARQYFSAVKQFLPDDHLADLYMERCIKYIKTQPSAEWDGVELMDEK